MNTDTVYSVYIPNVHNKWTRSAIADFFQRSNYGFVHRIDFTKILLSDGTEKPNFKSAFVFFTSNNPENPLTKDLGARGYRMHPTMRVYDHRGFDKYVNHTSSNGQHEYWIALPNKSVVPDSDDTIQHISNRLGACYELFRIIPQTEDSLKDFDAYLYDCKCLDEYEHASPEEYDLIFTNKHQLSHNSKLLFNRLVLLALYNINNNDDKTDRNVLRGIHPAIDEFL